MPCDLFTRRLVPADLFGRSRGVGGAPRLRPVCVLRVVPHLPPLCNSFPHLSAPFASLRQTSRAWNRIPIRFLGWEEFAQAALQREGMPGRTSARRREERRRGRPPREAAPTARATARRRAESLARLSRPLPGSAGAARDERRAPGRRGCRKVGRRAWLPA